MRHAPGPYADWRAWLDAFAKGIDLPAEHLAPIGEQMGPHVQERLMRHIAEAFAQRQRRWADTFQRDLGTLTGDPVHALAAILASARTRLAPLRKFCASPAMTPALREELTSALDETLRSSQRSLEDSVRHAPIALQAVVRDNRLTTAPPPLPAPGGQSPGRRVII
ncbi:hypothetical protein OG205_20500 [Lentzea sp. NBC_00516]|uniref:hypothetical protein n=1 Tax=Lentzea sp. NBC_00516 TaxID=2903582 RepID=UPI002E82043A|nr:hypothetical protein [Lentzea sp. NBC_00516]WUD29301.1 hypothetical protein OG205_20500 [Lentzea sp. NBC_00516]